MEELIIVGKVINFFGIKGELKVKSNFDKKENMKCFLDPCGSHVSRINTLPSTLRNEVIALIKKWME